MEGAGREAGLSDATPVTGGTDGRVGAGGLVATGGFGGTGGMGAGGLTGTGGFVGTGGLVVDPDDPFIYMPTGTCPEGLPGPELVNVPAPIGTFCIDATEVTRDQYQTFLDAGAMGSVPAELAAECTGAGAVPSCAWPPAGGEGNLPVVCVGGCDAAAYCAWAGKRMCRPAQGADSGGSEYAIACGGLFTDFGIASKYSAYDYPWRSFDFDRPDACNVGEAGYGRVLPVASLPACEGTYTGLFDLVGNVAELTICGHDGTPHCARGGSYPTVETPVGVTTCGGVQVRQDAEDVGFRCCADALENTQ